MSKYVKVEDIKNTLIELVKSGEWLGRKTTTRIIKALGDIPTIEVSEGKWIVSEDGDSICSVCGESEDWFIYGTENWYGKGYSNYCPNCGAKMKGAEE